MVVPFEALACPLDGLPLQHKGTSWVCANGHNFDIARQGYTNLLPVQNKRSLDPGDSKEMVAARQRFLNGGFYQPLAEAVSKTVLDTLSSSATVSCLDAGCGEGYYLRFLAALVDEEHSVSLLGLDISKWAILSAAKQDKQSNWVVASNANLPVQTGSLDWILSVFGFPVYAEFARVLKPKGELLVVTAGPDHLLELREIIYDTLKPQKNSELALPEGFSYVSTQTVRYPLALSGTQQIADLLAMTPHLYRINAQGRAKAAALTDLCVTVDIRLTRFCRNEDGVGNPERDKLPSSDLVEI